MSSKRTVVRNGRIVRHDRIMDGHLVIENGVIADLMPAAAEVKGDEVIDARGCYILPGFVDLHVHGGVGFDLTAGLFDPVEKRFDSADGRYREMLPRVAKHMARHGTTSALLATVAGSEEKLARVFSLLADYVEGPTNGVDGCHIGGAFMEGTFIKDARYAGAQNPEFFCEPSLEMFERLNGAARGTIRYVNIAPEFGAEAVTLIRELTRRGVLVGAGHTSATAKEYYEAVHNGLRMAVHLTNGPTGSSFKPFDGGGALQAALCSPQVFAEIIVDGYHIYAGYICDILRRKGPYRVCLITDAMFATEAQGVTDFEVQGVRGQVSLNGRYLCVVGAANTLFGSVLTMDVGFCNVVNWLTAGVSGVWTGEHAPLDIESAILAASRFASANAARALGLYEPENSPFGRPLSGCFGSLMVGKRADVVAMRLPGEPGKFSPKVEHVFIGGRRIHLHSEE